MGDGLLSLNWNNHGSTFHHALSSLRSKDKYTDVTVSCGGKFYQVHKLVLSTCSEYFEKIFENTPCKHPVIVLKDVQCDELESLLNYMYNGVVSVVQRDLSRLIKVAELLQIKGLAVPDEPPDEKGSIKRTNNDSFTSPSNVDVASPSAKRRRKQETNIISSELQPRNVEPQESQTGDKDNRLIDDRLSAPAADHDVNPPLMVQLGEPFTVKEELDDEIDDIDQRERNFQNDGSSRSNINDSHQDTNDLAISDQSTDFVMSKFEEDPDRQSANLDEVKAGPSGLQGWATEDDMADQTVSGETFDSESQDMSSSVDLLSQQAAADSRQMMEMQTKQSKQAKKPRKSRKRSNFTQKKHRCTICRYSTTFKGNFDSHMRTHTGEKPFQCPQCPSKFTVQTNLTTHLRIHTGEKPFECPYCPAKFAVQTNLRTHQRKHTGEKPFQCPSCPSKFSLKSNLNSHLRTHIKEMFFQCSQCSMTFVDHFSLKTHEELHAKEDLYQNAISMLKIDFTSDINQDISKVYSNITESQVYPGMAKSQEVYPNLPESRGIYPNLTESLEVHPDVAESQGIYPDMSESQEVYPNMNESQEISPNGTEVNPNVPENYINEEILQCDLCNFHSFTKAELRDHIFQNHMASNA